MRFLPFVFVIICFQFLNAEELYQSVYLTFEKEDTSRFITLNILSKKLDVVRDVELYEKQPGLESLSLVEVRGFADGLTPVPELGQVEIYRFENLNPDTIYVLKIHSLGNGVIEENREYYFKTLPDVGGEVHIVQGGDMKEGPTFSKVSAASIDKEPELILIGGDIAYGDGKIEKFGKWETWFENMNSVMMRPDGRLIPLVVAIGNHEVNYLSNVLFWEEKSPFYTTLFTQGGKSYFSRKISDHTILHVLDSGHLVRHSQQVSWLQKQMQKYSEVKNKLALYHIPLYPSHRSYRNFLSYLGRKHWGPVFDQYGLSLGIENHDHTLKRTYDLKNRKKVSQNSGTVYIGDGCWGASVRKAQSRWYLKKSLSERHVWNLWLSQEGIKGEAYNQKEDLLDAFIRL